MHARLTTALHVVRHLCDRPDPLDPVTVGALAAAVDVSASSASRIAAELEAIGLISRGAGYGTYRIGPGALELSGAAARPYSGVLDFALTAAYQATGETVAVVAASPGGATVIGVVESAWTLRVATRVGERIADQGSAARRALDGAGGPSAVVQSTIGVTGEVAAPIRLPSGECVAALVVRYPSHRAGRVTPRARRAVLAASEQVEAHIAQTMQAAHPPGAPDVAADVEPDSWPGRGDTADGDPGGSTVRAASGILSLVAATGSCSIHTLATRTGIRADRVARLVETLVMTGLLVRGADGHTVRLGWAVQAWHRAIIERTLRGPAQRLVAAASSTAGTTAYLTVRRGMRSSTVAEAIVDGALHMGSWLGRPAQLIGSDGGPVLVLNLDDAQIRQVFPPHITQTASGTPKDLEAFLQQVRRARSEQTLALPDFGEDGLTSVASPVRDAGGSVVAAACIVGPTDHMSARLPALKRLAGELACDVSLLLRNPEPPNAE